MSRRHSFARSVLMLVAAAALIGLPVVAVHGQGGAPFTPHQFAAAALARRFDLFADRDAVSEFGETLQVRVGAVHRHLKRLADARINVTAADAVTAGKGRFGMILWVKAKDYGRAARALGAG